MGVNKLAVVRIRGDPGLKKEVRDTLKMLNLDRPNQCTVISDESTYRGMLEKCKEVVTWGGLDSEVFERLLLERGEFEGGETVSDESVDERTSFDSVEDIAESICEGDLSLSDVEDLKCVFRLHPPKKGYNSVGRSFENGGAKGFTGDKINDLIMRMI